MSTLFMLLNWSEVILGADQKNYTLWGQKQGINRSARTIWVFAHPFLSSLLAKNFFLSLRLRANNCHTAIIGRVRRNKSLVTRLYHQLVLLSWTTGSISNGNVSAFDIIGSKVHEIAGDNVVTIGNEESCWWQHCNLSPKLCHQSSNAAYSINNRIIKVVSETTITRLHQFI